jgi:hypothetical protein
MSNAMIYTPCTQSPSRKPEYFVLIIGLKFIAGVKRYVKKGGKRKIQTPLPKCSLFHNIYPSHDS